MIKCCKLISYFFLPFRWNPTNPNPMGWDFGIPGLEDARIGVFKFFWKKLIQFRLACPGNHWHTPVHFNKSSVQQSVEIAIYCTFTFGKMFHLAKLNLSNKSLLVFWPQIEDSLKQQYLIRGLWHVVVRPRHHPVPIFNQRKIYDFWLRFWLTVFCEF